jgi:hypothetical protein
MKTTETTTSCIVHLAECANFERIASAVRCNDLISSCFESPSDTIYVTVGGILKNNDMNYDKKKYRIWNWKSPVILHWI